MKKVLGVVLCATLLAPAAGMAAPQRSIGGNENGRPGTVDYFTPAQKAQAFKAASGDGYTPKLVEAYQDGNFFLTAGKGGEIYEVTVASSGQVYPSAPLAPVS